MSRKKKIKTEEEIKEYNLRRRIQNRINQRNYRLRIKLKSKTLDVNQIKKEIEFKKELITFLKELNFNYFITLTTRYEMTFKKIKIYLDKFLLNINNSIKLDRLYYVIERDSRTHIHILIKSEINSSLLKEVINLIWKEGFIHSKKIYSNPNDLTLENYLTKEIKLSSDLNWGML
jgi:hypothetical protein